MPRQRKRTEILPSVLLPMRLRITTVVPTDKGNSPCPPTTPHRSEINTEINKIIPKRCCEDDVVNMVAPPCSLRSTGGATPRRNITSLSKLSRFYNGFVSLVLAVEAPRAGSSL